MSNQLAVATVTATLRRTLQAAVQVDFDSATATALRPDLNASGLPNPGVNVFLYQVSPNVAWRNSDLPTRDGSGQAVQRPRVALDLHYLLTFYGDELQLESQRVLGTVVRHLHSRPLITRRMIENMLADPLFSFLADSNLASELEVVKLTPVPFSLEELSKLWSVLFQTTYTLSMAYMASVVLIEADDNPRRALPVRERRIRAFPFSRATLDRVSHPAGADVAIQFGDHAVLHGSKLGGAVSHIRVGVADVQPIAGGVAPTRITTELTDPGLRAGLFAAQVVFADDTVSTVAPMSLRPNITIQPGVTDEQIPVGFTPQIDRGQPVVLFLNELNPPANRPPFAYSFEAPADNGIADPNVPDTAAITFAINGVEAATYLVRVQVSGAESVFEVDDVEASPTFGEYIGPTAVVP